jgi:glycosyltransferase involved in cell wall biosynthesis
VDNGKELKEIACEEYTWAKIAKEYEALYWNKKGIP